MGIWDKFRTLIFCTRIFCQIKKLGLADEIHNYLIIGHSQIFCQLLKSYSVLICLASCSLFSLACFIISG
ncbi:MAG: hypothetical protein A2V73_06455 [candidate division Zixibacteria bacterium RBG_19FT_COMBO_42_43]|nr:MAG: hypothetical protein A2V73_06455 [candidate division Zixibacteria bacterium RBG_19FT_COMBO_42_43]